MCCRKLPFVISTIALSANPMTIIVLKSGVTMASSTRHQKSLKIYVCSNRSGRQYSTIKLINYLKKSLTYTTALTRNLDKESTVCLKCLGLELLGKFIRKKVCTQELS